MDHKWTAETRHFLKMRSPGSPADDLSSDFVIVHFIIPAMTLHEDTLVLCVVWCVPDYLASVPLGGQLRLYVVLSTSDQITQDALQSLL